MSKRGAKRIFIDIFYIYFFGILRNCRLTNINRKKR